MLRTGARFHSEFSECSARERDLFRKIQDALHGSAVFNDEVDKGSTQAILTDYRGTPLKTAMLNEERDLELPTPVVNQYSIRQLSRSVFERRSLYRLATGVLRSRQPL